MKCGEKNNNNEIGKLDKEWRIDPMHWKAKELTKKKKESIKATKDTDTNKLTE